MKRLAIGLMSGTSVDGVDAALVELDSENPREFKLLEFSSHPYSAEQRKKILDLCDEQTATLPDICQMNFRLGEIFAQSVLDLLQKAKLSPKQVDFIGSHGQTIYHIPGQCTLQIGDASVIAQKTGITTVADFRPADLAVGGQGAPLVPFFDQLVFGQEKEVSAIQNIGGIGNVTVVGQKTESLPWIAFDTGPGNMIMDYFATKASSGQLAYDQDGLLAQKGQVHESIVADLLTHPYFRQEPPKSTGRELFGVHFSEELQERYSLNWLDWVATATAFTASSIVNQYELFIQPFTKIDRILVAGGGTQNPTLLEEIRRRSQLPVFVHDDFGISSEAKEAIAFALLAQATIEGRPSNVPRATGAKKEVILGKICRP